MTSQEIQQCKEGYEPAAGSPNHPDNASQWAAEMLAEIAYQLAVINENWEYWRTRQETRENADQ